MLARSITKDEVSELIKVNKQQLMNSFKDLLQDTVSQTSSSSFKWLQDQDKPGVVNSIFDYNDLVLETKDDFVLGCNVVSFLSEIHPLVFDLLNDSPGTFNFSSLPTVQGRLFGVL